MVYNALVFSHLNYCDVIWANCGKTLLNILQRIQNRGARLINNTPWFSSGKENLDLLNWDPIVKKIENDTAIIMYKVMTKQVPPYISEKFKHRTTVYNTRQSSMCFDVPRPKTESGKRRFLYRGAQILNSLTEDAQKSPSVGIFQYKLTNY